MIYPEKDKRWPEEYLRGLYEQRPTSGLVADASCVKSSGSKERDGYHNGTTEWQVYDLETKAIVLKSQDVPQSTNNIAEFLALCDALRVAKPGQVIYSDSKITAEWVKKRRVSTALPKNEKTKETHRLMDDALQYLKNDKPTNQVLWWDEFTMGPNPADFLRKGPRKEFTNLQAMDAYARNLVATKSSNGAGTNVTTCTCGNYPICAATKGQCK